MSPSSRFLGESGKVGGAEGLPPPDGPPAPPAAGSGAGSSGTQVVANGDGPPAEAQLPSVPCPDAPSPDRNESAQVPSTQSTRSNGVPAGDEPSGHSIFGNDDTAVPADDCGFNCGSGIGGIDRFNGEPAFVLALPLTPPPWPPPAPAPLPPPPPPLPLPAPGFGLPFGSGAGKSLGLVTGCDEPRRAKYSTVPATANPTTIRPTPVHERLLPAIISASRIASSALNDAPDTDS